MFEDELALINERLQTYALVALQEGEDKYVVLTYKGDLIIKSFLELSKHDIIFGKIVLTWKDSSLDYKYIPFEPYQIQKRIKFKDNKGKNVKYFLLFLPCLNQYCIQSPSNPVRFEKAKEVEKYIYKYELLDKFDRDWKYGITKKAI